MLARRHWIAPGALLYAQLAHGCSWLILLYAAASASAAGTGAGFAWIHTVALGWVTMAALAILIHALPAFTDTTWRGESAARWSLVAYAFGVTMLVAGFLGEASALVAAGAAAVVLALAVYLTTAALTIAGAMRGERVARAVARAFAGTFAFLAVAALMGLGMALVLAGARAPAWIAMLPSAHADLGTLGWLSLLIFGVSMRTFRPILGVQTRLPWMHIVVGLLAVLGVPLLSAGVALGSGALARVGGSLFGLAALGYVSDALDRLRRTDVHHRPPQAFILAALCWLLYALALGAGLMLGQPWQTAYVFALLIGWIGQMVNAHLHHIGVRLIATVYRGEEDETQPGDLLDARLSWSAFTLFQIAIALVCAALLLQRDALLAIGAALGFVAWIAMSANLVRARAQARNALVRGRR